MAVLLATLPAVANDASVPASEIIKTFEQYERLNADFLSAVGTGKGKSGKTYAQLRTKVEAYAEGPFEGALNSAVQLVCGKRNKGTGVVKALFKVKVATLNSASESPSTALGRMFVCHPDLVSAQLKAETPEMQRQLYPALRFGFENAVLGYPTGGKDVEALRMSLKALEPESK